MVTLEYKDTMLFFALSVKNESIAVIIVDREGEIVEEFIDIHNGSVFIMPISKDVQNRVRMALGDTNRPTVFIKDDKWTYVKQVPFVKAEPKEESYSIEGLLEIVKEAA